MSGELDLMTVKEVGDALHIEALAVYRLCSSGKFPNATKPGRKWLIPRQDVINYVKARQNQ